MNNKQTTKTNVLRDCMSRWPIATFLCGIGVGASLMYLLDPRLGSRRRAYIGQQVRGAINDLEDAAGSRVRDLRNRAKGVVAEARSALTKTSDENESTQMRPEREMVEGRSASSEPQAA